jgi:hypothetical protein
MGRSYENIISGKRLKSGRNVDIGDKYPIDFGIGEIDVGRTAT